MTETPTTTLQVFPTADGKRWRCTCPFHAHPTLVYRHDSAKHAGLLMTEHIKRVHGWKVLSVQTLESGADHHQEPKP
jgi:hypothetical protein